VNVGEDLMFGNFYAGAIHGLKLQSDSNNPAPMIPIQLIDTSGAVVDEVETTPDGEYWFLDVRPGAYTIREVATDAIIDMALPVPITVEHATAYFSPLIPVGDRMFYPGLQTPATNASLTLRNKVEGSIHGQVCNQNGTPLQGIAVTLTGPEAGATVTNATGEFHFEDLTPGNYVVNVNGQQLVVIVGSGEEEVAFLGQSDLDPGQFETQNNALKFTIVVAGDIQGPRVDSIKVGSSSWAANFINFVDTDAVKVGYEVPNGADQLDPLPWINIDKVFVRLNEDVQRPGGADIGVGDIELVGVNVANYSALISSVTYNSATFTATVMLSQPIGPDKLLVHIKSAEVQDTSANPLDGEWVNSVSTYPSGNGVNGGNFNFRFNVLPGDSNQTGVVNVTDTVKVRNGQFQSVNPLTAGYSIFNDLNGSGAVNVVDTVAARNRQFTSLPVGEPIPPALLLAGGSAVLDAAFADDGAGSGADDDDLLLLAVNSATRSSSNAAFESLSTPSGNSKSVGSIDDLFAALGSQLR
jgi:hypothetical protein